MQASGTSSTKIACFLKLAQLRSYGSGAQARILKP